MWVYDTQPVAGTIESNVSNYHADIFGGGFTHLFTPNLLVDVRGGAMLKPYVFNPTVSKLGITGATDAGFKNVDQYMAACTSTWRLPMAMLGAVGTIWETLEIHNAAILW
jgi:hypothetical protein